MKTRASIRSPNFPARKFGKPRKTLPLKKAAAKASLLLCGGAFLAAGAFSARQANGTKPLAGSAPLEAREGERGGGEAGFSNQERLAHLCKIPPGGKGPLPYEVQQAEQAVWIIKNPANGGFGASGFFIGPRLLLTNFHVIDRILSAGGKIEASFLSHHALSGAGPIKVKGARALDPVYDLALLETEGEAPYLSLAERAPEEEDSLFALGYFGQVFQTVRKSGPLKRLDDFLIFPVNRTPYFHFERGGQSGGPVLSAEGRVVGMLSQEAGNFHAARPLRLLRSFTENQSGLQCGESEAKDCFAEALDRLNKEAEEGRLPALYRLGETLIRNAKPLPDLDRLVSLFHQAAEGGHILSAYALSGQAYETKAKRIFWLERAAAEGLAAAQRKLAETALRLFGQKRTAAYWMRQAAEAGESEAQYQLSRPLPAAGEKFADLEDALLFERRFFWLKQAAANGHVPAAQDLALICYEGRGGLEPDFEAAAYWFKQASDRLRSAHRSLNEEI